jgi:hypothetical protein
MQHIAVVWLVYRSNGLLSLSHRRVRTNRRSRGLEGAVCGHVCGSPSVRIPGCVRRRVHRRQRDARTSGGNTEGEVTAVATPLDKRRRIRSSRGLSTSRPSADSVMCAVGVTTLVRSAISLPPWPAPQKARASRTHAAPDRSQIAMWLLPSFANM